VIVAGLANTTPTNAGQERKTMKKLATALALATFAFTGTACDQVLGPATNLDQIQANDAAGCNESDSEMQPLCSPNPGPGAYLTGN
jgi:hypothetical protein